MFRINAFKILINTDDGKFGVEETFNSNINFIASYKNTRGKSTCIEAIYYCLGLEELLGGQNANALRPALRKELEYENKKYTVIQSEIYLEIENDKECVTLKRSVKNEGVSSKLITVFYGNMKDVLNGKVKSEDMYVHDSGSATNEKGFHRFLEAYIGWNLPLVPTFDTVDRKLYIQTLFPAVFIEQKRGWSDIMATVPTKFKIKEVSKRVLEFLLKLETLENERKKQEYTAKVKKIKSFWEDTIVKVKQSLFHNSCSIDNLPANPQIIQENFVKDLIIYKMVAENDGMPLSQYIARCESEIKSMGSDEEITISDKSNELEIELSYKQEEVLLMDLKLSEERKRLSYERENIEVLKERLHIVSKDLVNNKDALKLKNMGSIQGWEVNKDICPTCQQKIHDSLLPQDTPYNLMTIEENINYLQAQKEMLEFTIENHNATIEETQKIILSLEAKLFTARKIIRSIKNDLNSKEQNVSEAVVRRKINIEAEIEKLKKLDTDIKDSITTLIPLSNQWKDVQTDINKLPKDKFTELDKKKIETLRDRFRRNLVEFGFSSTSPLEVEISEEKYLPTIEGFDMKFDSSASDSIRAIWAFTLALQQTSNTLAGNHPNIVIFDEPGQQSIENIHIKKFLQQISEIKLNCQVIIGIALIDEGIKELITGLTGDEYKVIVFEEKAIKPLVDEMGN